jgi:hypothetical protein
MRPDAGGKLGWWWLAGAASLASLVACAPGAVGDPCTPSRPAVDGGARCGAGAGAGACLLESEVYVEATSLQCRTRVCLSYHWEEQRDRDQANARSFCTCRCSGPGDPATLCQCPEGFACEPIFAEIGAAGVRGSYCVRQQILR